MLALAGFNGINLLYGGSLKVLFNEQSTWFLTIAGVTFTSTGSRAPPRQSPLSRSLPARSQQAADVISRNGGPRSTHA
jgi:hypothetical protein